MHGLYYSKDIKCVILHSIQNIGQDSRRILRSQYSFNNEKKMHLLIQHITFHEEGREEGVLIAASHFCYEGLHFESL